MDVIFDRNVYTRQPAVLTVSDWDGEAEWLKVVVRTAPSVTTWYKFNRHYSLSISNGE